jgi:hypothetical protein
VSIAHQAELIGLSRSRDDDQPQKQSTINERVMHLMNKQETRPHPWSDDRPVTASGDAMNHKGSRQFMRMMGSGVMPPNSRRCLAMQGHDPLPSFLRKMPITRPDQGW